jgi:hypothetical protein
MKRYLLFAWPSYDAQGGWNDLKESFDTIDEARKYLETLDSVYDEREIIDSQTGMGVE